MKLAVTGCSGSVGRRVVLLALKQGHSVVGLDHVPILPQPDGLEAKIHSDTNFTFLQVDLQDYIVTLNALRGCDAVVQLAACPNPGDYIVTTHNTNVVISWNVLRAAAELCINRVAQASSVNVITMVYSQQPHFEYFPIDEDHPCLPDEPYGLSKVISELQADTIVRGFPALRIASLRLHWSIPHRSRASVLSPDRAAMDLWGYVQEDSCARAFLLAVCEDNRKWNGHERFFIAAPWIACDGDSGQLRRKYWKDVPIKEGFEVEGRTGFFDCAKAKRLLNWVHEDPNY